MYKLSDVAKKLNVEKVLLFEMLLTKGEYLEGNVIKKYGVTYLSDDGIDIIDRIIRGEEVEIPVKNIESQSEEENDEVNLKNENELHISKEIDETSDLEDKENSEDKKDEVEIKKEDALDESQMYKIQSTNKDDINDEVKNLEILTAKSKFSKFEKEEKRNRISKLRNEFILLDSQIRKKQEALESYDKILEEDIQWVSILEDKLSVKLKEKFADEDTDVHQKRMMEKMFFKK